MWGAAYIDTDKIENFKDFPCLYELDLTNHTTKAAYYFPKTYQKGLYGINFVINTFYTFQPEKKIIVFSFSNDKNIYAFDIRTNQTQILEVSSKYFTDIPPIESNANISDFNVYTKFYVQSNSYGPIYYDKYRKVYYRFAERGVDDKSYKEKKWWKRKSIIITDEMFNKIGEFDIPDSINHWSGFVTDKGFYLLDTSFENENFVYFIGYKFTNDKNDKNDKNEK